jgi:Inner membrane protein YgaP-like, transmembrane domain
MTVDRAVTAFAGFMVLLSVALGHYVSPYWYWLTVFVGANLLQSSFTGFCPAAMIFKKLGVKPGLAFP